LQRTLAISRRSLGLDLVLVSRLRNEPYSGLTELVERTPGYHVDADGFIYSDDFSSGDIAVMRNRINSQFYSPLHVARVVNKLRRVLQPRVKAKGLLTIPLFLTRIVGGEVHRKVCKWMGQRAA
jgi:hypothetical protein